MYTPARLSSAAKARAWERATSNPPRGESNVAPCRRAIAAVFAPGRAPTSHVEGSAAAALAPLAGRTWGVCGGRSAAPAGVAIAVRRAMPRVRVQRRTRAVSPARVVKRNEPLGNREVRDVGAPVWLPGGDAVLRAVVGQRVGDREVPGAVGVAALGQAALLAGGVD